ncbi:hypothetical protein TNCV_28101 [Trichonephila clavipes]|uniref:Uncharacterized protein n=1 Tax=Trichonephila clavipes TaxID=2585209 RepID=A0A8X6WKI2_TRICX|nr:hypothetical protein TNCV_28101 [Trichonephila clavipes]
MVAERLARHHMAVTMVYELWHRIEAAWTSIPCVILQYENIELMISGKYESLQTMYDEESMSHPMAGREVLHVQ